MMRRRVLVSAVLASVLGLLSVPSAGIAATEVVIAAWTGGYDKIFEEKILADFLKQRDVKLRWVLGSAVANFAKVKAGRDNPEIDVVLADDLPQRAALNEGLFEPLDSGLVSNLSNLRELARLPGDQGVGFTMNISGIVYHRDVFKEKNLPIPTSWNDFFREDLRKRIIISPLTFTESVMLLIQMARLHGGSERNIEPGFAKLKELASRALEFPRTAAIISSLFQRREAWMTNLPLDFATLQKQKGIPIEFVFPKEGAPARTYTISVVKNAPQKRMAQELVNYLLGDRVQERVADELKTAPVNRRARMSPEIAAMLEKLYPLDIDYINTNRPMWIERWNKEIEGG